MILRATEAARLVIHIPKILYHWRIVEGSTAGSVDAKPYTFDSQTTSRLYQREIETIKTKETKK